MKIELEPHLKLYVLLKSRTNLKVSKKKAKAHLGNIQDSWGSCLFLFFNELENSTGERVTDTKRSVIKVRILRR